MREIVVPQILAEAERSLQHNLFTTQLYVVEKPRQITVLPYYVVAQENAENRDHSGDILLAFQDLKQNSKLSVVKNSCSILGSFRYKADIDCLINYFVGEWLKVLAPPTGDVDQEVNGFKTLVGDTGVDEALGEVLFLEGMAKSSALYIYNKDGYIGRSTCMEMNIARAIGIPMFAKEKVEFDARINPDLCNISVASCETFASIVSAGFKKRDFPEQSWVKRKRENVQFKGFSGIEGKRNILMVTG